MEGIKRLDSSCYIQVRGDNKQGNIIHSYSPSSESALKGLQIRICINLEGVFMDHPTTLHYINPVVYPLAASVMNEGWLYESEGSIAGIVGEPIITLALLYVQSRSTWNGGDQFYLLRLSHKGTSISLKS